jgi:hypothetical protein
MTRSDLLLYLDSSFWCRYIRPYHHLTFIPPDHPFKEGASDYEDRDLCDIYLSPYPFVDPVGICWV